MDWLRGVKGYVSRRMQWPSDVVLNAQETAGLEKVHKSTHKSEPSGIGPRGRRFGVRAVDIKL